ncbi:MAG TPA: hypothetical protein VMT17_15830 [Anaeromyxobacteraceae bacterium]|nr:hypothetical protein [Anaeromyxobacteraceae bacterium]
MRKALLVACALASAGCEVYAVPAALVCPGQRQATFSFRGVQQANACSFASQASPSVNFVGTLAYATDGGSDACLSQNQPHARLNLGTHTGDSIAVGSVDVGGAVSGCSCPVTIAQRIEGDVLRGDGGSYVAFDGGLFTDVSALSVDGGSASGTCPCGSIVDGGCSCELPCTIPYELSAQVVDSP